MNKPEFSELEKDFKAYKFRCLIKKCLAAFVLCACVGGAFWAFKAFKDKNDTIKIAIDEKNKMQEKLEIAKIQAQKAQILIDKRQNQATQITPEPKPAPNNKITIHSYVASADKLEQAFAQKAEYQTALKLANLHFADKDYEKALQWSLKANELNKNDAGAWVAFAKAKFALDKKDEAKRALQSFLHYYGDNADTSVLDEVQYILK